MERNGVILLVEDNPDDELLTKRAFRKHQVSYPVVTVRDGQEALDYLLAHGAYAERKEQEKPVLVLLDLNLPKVSGHQVLKTIREHQHTYPVVMLSTSDEHQDVQMSYALGANSFVRKPVDFMDFVQSVGDILRYWLHINLSPAAV